MVSVVQMRTTKRIGWVTALAVLGGLAVGQVEAQQAGSNNNDRIVTTYTEPSQRAEMSFKQFGIAWKVPVKEGSRVKRGDLLIEQDDRLEQKQYESAKLQGDSVLKIEAQKKDLAVREIELKRVKGLHEKGGIASQLELEKYQLDRDLSEAQVAVATEEKQIKTYDAEAMAVRLEQMKMLAPFDGEVERILTDEGEATDPQKPSIVVVKNDPLWVVVNLPSRVTDYMKMGQELQVRYSDKDDAAYTEKQPWQSAKVSFISPAGDASSDKRLVRLTLENPGGISSGREIQVKLPGEFFGNGPVEKTASAGK